MGVLAVDVDFQGTVRERSSRLLETAGGGSRGIVRLTFKASIRLFGDVSPLNPGLLREQPKPAIINLRLGPSAGHSHETEGFISSLIIC